MMSATNIVLTRGKNKVQSANKCIQSAKMPATRALWPLMRDVMRTKHGEELPCKMGQPYFSKSNLI